MSCIRLEDNLSSQKRLSQDSHDISTMKRMKTGEKRSAHSKTVSATLYAAVINERNKLQRQVQQFKTNWMRKYP